MSRKRLRRWINRCFGEVCRCRSLCNTRNDELSFAIVGTDVSRRKDARKIGLHVDIHNNLVLLQLKTPLFNCAEVAQKSMGEGRIVRDNLMLFA